MSKMNSTTHAIIFISCTSAFLATSDTPWVIDFGASNHMTGIKNKFHSSTYNCSQLSVHILHGSSSPVYGCDSAPVTILSYLYCA